MSFRIGRKYAQHVYPESGRAGLPLVVGGVNPIDVILGTAAPGTLVASAPNLNFDGTVDAEVTVSFELDATNSTPGAFAEVRILANGVTVDSTFTDTPVTNGDTIIVTRTIRSGLSTNFPTPTTPVVEFQFTVQMNPGGETPATAKVPAQTGYITVELVRAK